MKQIFIINGSGGVGKDTFVNKVTNVAHRLRLIPVYNFSSVEKVKRIAKKIGWDGVSKTEKDRKFLSDLKLLCTEYNDMPFESMREKVEEFKEDKYASMLFLHIREPEEIERAKNAFYAKTILVKRDSVKHITSNMADENVYNYKYDIIINNDGTLEDLKKIAKDFVEDWMDGEFKKEYNC